MAMLNNQRVYIYIYDINGWYQWYPNHISYIFGIIRWYPNQYPSHEILIDSLDDTFGIVHRSSWLDSPKEVPLLPLSRVAAAQDCSKMFWSMVDWNAAS